MHFNKQPSSSDGKEDLVKQAHQQCDSLLSFANLPRKQLALHPAFHTPKFLTTATATATATYPLPTVFFEKELFLSRFKEFGKLLYFVCFLILDCNHNNNTRQTTSV